MRLYGIIPPPARSIDLGAPDERDDFVNELVPPPGPWVRAIMVTNSAGEMSGVDGSSRSLSRGSDRALLALHRSVVDAVIVGAATIKAEPVPVPSSVPLVVITRSGDLSNHQLTNTQRGELVVVTGAAGSTTASSSLENLPHRVLTLEGSDPFSGTAIAALLKESLGAQALLIEGGRSVYETFAPITDEVALSVTPPPRHERAGIPPWWPLSTEAWALTSLMTDDDKMLYYRYLTAVRGAPSEWVQL